MLIINNFYLFQVNEPVAYAPFSIEKNGHSYMEFNTRLEKVSIINSQSVSAETLGSWRAGLNSPLVIKDSNSMKNFSAVTVYRIVTVLVIINFT